MVETKQLNEDWRQNQWRYLQLSQNNRIIDLINVDFIILDPAAPDIQYSTWGVGASLIIIFIGNPDVDNIGDAILVLF